jgi:DNA topoisomerase-2
MKEKNIEEKYKILDQISHVLLRPGVYIGSCKPTLTNKWILKDNKMSFEEISYIPAFIKLYDEILMNAIDESKRNKLNTIKVTVDGDRIRVYDNGGISIVKHKEYDKFIPEIIFGTLLSGSNFDEDDERKWAGQNGIGAKATNIFSKEFIITTCDGKNLFTQTFTNNMRNFTEPIIKKAKSNHTEIIYLPDYEKLGMNGMDDIHFNVIKKRTYDVAACNTNVKIYFNDELIDFKSFKNYIELYSDKIFYENTEDIRVGIAPSNDGYKQVSFVNGCETYDGGTHETYVLNQIISELRLFFQKKHKVDIKPSDIKNHIFLFLDCEAIRPTFSSQTKEKLITEIKDFGFTYQVSAKLIKEILKSEIVETILDWIARKKDAEANKLAREVNKNLAKIKVDKLIDAKGKNRRECCICLFEGDSAASAFRTYRDPNLHGAFCLRGKFVNATDMTNDKLVQNKEVLNFMAAMGLRLGEVAEPERLRYGKILIFTDADFDGYSINGLLINFFWKYWPELFYHKMVYRVETPIVVSQNIKSKKKINFYTQEEYSKWLETITPKEWIIKYKKGLAALSNDEYEEIILKPRLMSILPDDFSSDSLNIWFGKDSELRKEQLLKLQ